MKTKKGSISEAILNIKYKNNVERNNSSFIWRESLFLRQTQIQYSCDQFQMFPQPEFK